MKKCVQEGLSRQWSQHQFNKCSNLTASSFQEICRTDFRKSKDTHIQVCPWLDQEHKLNKNNQEHQVCGASSKVMRNPSKLITSPWQLGPTPSQRPPSNARKLAVITQFVVLAAPVVVALLACCLPAVLGCCCSLQWELAQNGETEVKCSMNRS